jgi:hypothetical protein
MTDKKVMELFTGKVMELFTGKVIELVIEQNGQT